MNKAIITTVLLLFTLLSTTAKEWSSVKEGLGREEVIKLVGKSSKVLKNSEGSAEIWIYYETGETWFVVFDEEQKVVAATTVEKHLEEYVDNIEAIKMGIAKYYEESLKALLNETLNGSESAGNQESGSDTEPSPPDHKAIIDKIELTLLDVKTITNYSDEKYAGFRLKLKNHSEYTITDLKITVYYLDKSNRPFYEADFYPVNPGSWSGYMPLKPNYSMLYPSEKNTYKTESGLDLNEWQKGKIKVEISEIKLEGEKEE